MDKENIFKSSKFWMDKGDVLNIIIKNITGDGITIGLNNTEGDVVEDGITIEDETTMYDLTDKDGNTYSVVTIGDQQWIIENLRTETYADGTAIPNKTLDADWIADTDGAYCYYDNDSATYKETYGALYNWYAVRSSHGLAYFERGGEQELGWHVPTYGDMNNLIDYIIAQTGCETYLLAGGYLKEIGTTSWDAPNARATDTFGFKGKACGFRTTTGSFGYDGERAMLFTVSGNEEEASLYKWAYALRLTYSEGAAFLAMLARDIAGLSIRCVRDVTASLRDYDGNVYTTVIIGNQEWTVENLRVTHYSSGDKIRERTQDADWIADVNGGYCWYDNDMETYGNDYGALYNFHAVNNDHGLVYMQRNGVQETGWRIPTNGDFETLLTYLGGATLAGGKLKEIGTTHWETPNEGASDDFGFSARGGGYRSQATGAFASIKGYAYLWSASYDLPGKPYNVLKIYSYNAEAELINTDVDGDNSGFSVRCVRDL